MGKQTMVRILVPGAADADDDVEETWTVKTHAMGDEWWSEILDPYQHPRVRHDEHGYDTVEKYYGDTPQESRAAALRALGDLVRERRGRVTTVGEPEDL